jgi:hypothetical protein
MKYTIETTPEEQIALYGMVENLFGTFCTTLVKMEKLRVKRRSTLPVTHEVVPESEDATAPEGEEADTRKVINFAVHERPVGSEVARGDDRDLSPLEEKPLPSKVEVDGKKLARGNAAFDRLVHLWARGFGVEDAEQPDRAEAMRAVANGPSAFAVLTYVKAAGGLTHAVNLTSRLGTAEYGTADEDVRRRLVLDVDANITQVASILFPDLSDLYEYKDIFATATEDYDHE